jgi:hypothetical protein
MKFINIISISIMFTFIFSLCKLEASSKHTAHSVLMIRPVQFCCNTQTAVSNLFQNQDQESTPEELQAAALKEFDQYVALLQKNDINVLLVEDTVSPVTPDSIFPNNWISLQPTGELITYPMCCENRRVERRVDLIEMLKSKYSIHREIDLSIHEKEGRFLEGTGSIIFDYRQEKAYACLSPRTDARVFGELCQQISYEGVLFHACDERGVPIYHTNVLMSIGEHNAVVCLDSISNTEERALLIQSLENSGREIIDISFEQMNQFCGNVLEVQNREGKSFLIMSDTAYRAFRPEQIECLRKNAVTILHTPLGTIESAGGGSARCMLAGIHSQSKL